MANDDPAPRDIGLAFDWLSRRLAELPVPARSVGRDPELADCPRPRPACGARVHAHGVHTQPAPEPASTAMPAPASAPEPAAPAPRTPASQAADTRPGSPPPEPGSPTPLLDKVGRDLTALARAGQLPVILGREAEIDAVIEILVRSRRHNPLLVAPEGTGRTAIVEGLATRIAAGDVPALLQGPADHRGRGRAT